MGARESAADDAAFAELTAGLAGPPCMLHPASPTPALHAVVGHHHDGTPCEPVLVCSACILRLVGRTMVCARPGPGHVGGTLRDLALHDLQETPRA